jgi:hypothetical protein
VGTESKALSAVQRLACCHWSVTQSIADAVRIKNYWVSDVVSQLEHLRPSGWDQTTKWAVPATIVIKSRNLGWRGKGKKKSPAAQTDTGMWAWGGSLRWLPLTSPCRIKPLIWALPREKQWKPKTLDPRTLEDEFGGRKKSWNATSALNTSGAPSRCTVGVMVWAPLLPSSPFSRVSLEISKIVNFIKLWVSHANSNWKAFEGKVLTFEETSASHIALSILEVIWPVFFWVWMVASQTTNLTYHWACKMVLR